MEESKDSNSEVGSTKETKQDKVPAIKDTMAAALEVNAHAADNATSIGSGSPTLLSLPPSPEPLAVEAPPPLRHITIDSSTTINYAAQAPWTPMPSIGDLPTADDGPMATLHWAISTHHAELDCQWITIGAKYDAFHDLLVKAQTNFDISAIKQRVRSAVGVHSAPLIKLVSNAEAAINVKYNNISIFHTTSKSALSEVLTLLDASNLSQRALDTVDNAMTAAVAPGDLIDQCISKEVTLAVIATVDKIVA